MSIDAKLAELGITLPEAAAPIANYVGYNVSGNLVVVSGQIPLKDGRVAYTGKVGVNVTPEVAKEAAKMILADDNFATIVKAVREGRGVYDNLRKIMMFVLPTSFAQSLGIALAIAPIGAWLAVIGLSVAGVQFSNAHDCPSRS